MAAVKGRPGDRGLRGLERRAASGEVEAQAELLIARHRLDQLPEERLRLGAHLQDPAAVIAAREILGVTPRKMNLGAWVRRIGTPDLTTWERELPWKVLVQPTCVRVALAATEAALPVWTSPEWRENVDPNDTELKLIREVHRDTKIWLAAPSSASAERVLRHAMGTSWSGVTAEAAVELVSIVCPPSLSMRRNRERELARSAANVVESAARTLQWSERSKQEVEASLRDTCREAALPWLLWS
jgi:hypothetical protein